MTTTTSTTIFLGCDSIEINLVYILLFQDQSLLVDLADDTMMEYEEGKKLKRILNESL